MCVPELWKSLLCVERESGSLQFAERRQSDAKINVSTTLNILQFQRDKKACVCDLCHSCPTMHGSLMVSGGVDVAQHLFVKVHAF